MLKFWKSVAIGAVLLMVLVVGYTLVLAQDSEDAEPPTAAEPADEANTPFGFGRRGGMPHGMGGWNGDWTMPEEFGAWGGRGFAMPHISWMDTVAEQLGLTTDELRAELAEGASIADLAVERGVEIQAIIDALVAEHQAALETAVEEGYLTQEQADAMQANAEERFALMLENAATGGFHHHGGAPGALPEDRMPHGRPGFGGGMLGFSLVDTVAEELGLTAEFLRAELAESSTIADLAAERGVDLQTIIEALLVEHQAASNAAVEDGRLSQEQADAMQEHMAEHITEILENGWNAGPCGPDGMRGGRDGRGMWHNDGAFPGFPRGSDTDTNTNA
jgi:DNA-binding ferritin-like protein